MRSPRTTPPPAMPVPTPARARAFTLPELLVVVGVIAIIASIILAGVHRARQQARLVECCSNLRGIGQACIQHAAAADGYLPLAGFVSASPGTDPRDYPAGVGDKGRAKYTYIPSPTASLKVTIVPFPAALAPYLGVDSLPKDNWDNMDQALNGRDGVWRRFMCPDTDAITRGKYNANPNDTNVQGQGTMMICAIGPNPATGWATNSDYAINEGLFGYHWDERYLQNRLAGNYRRLNRPGEVVLFTDAKPRAAPADPVIPLGWLCWTPSRDGTGPATLADALDGNGRVDSPDNFDRQRHGKRMNVVYADGRVETFEFTRGALARAFIVSAP